MPKNNKKEECNGTTHSACNSRMKKEGGKSRCCFCVPHSSCDIRKEDYSPAPVESWEEHRKNLEKLATKFPNSLLSCLDSAYLAGLEDANIKVLLSQQKQEILEMIEGIKCEERKVKTFGEFEAVTYEEKWMANEVLQDIKDKIEKL